ncbi:hypothetical protein [Actinomadura violacea]|uniref:Guanylate cyclase domain-containing protein n=1 Tax=Actinomadura violacea TaxID=2819934 RepID=A0ABS3RRB2_9ACTN|nr:hypothetical protein [Actinomadura violacea]MBO2458619.1 hypothetical protein [Actinomadura violacea]
MHEHMPGVPAKSLAVHRALLCVDVESYGGRANWDQLAVRAGLFDALDAALAESGVPAHWRTCEDRGDGALVLVTPEVPKERLAGPFPEHLAARIERHNAAAEPGARIRLRAALHAGEVHYDDRGVAGTAVNVAFRLLEAAPLKAALRTSPGVLAVIASDWIYQEVVQQNRTCRAAAYQRVRVSVKETRAPAWVRSLPAGPAAEMPVAAAAPVGGAVRRSPARARRPAARPSAPRGPARERARLDPGDPGGPVG